jgi:hypothetical protein
MATTVLATEAITARPLRAEEAPAAGDLHFAVGFGRQSAFVSRIIAAGTASRTNHVGVLAAVEPDKWEIIEALANGVRRNPHRPPPMSTVMRLSDDPSVRADVLAQAEELAAPGIKYDWLTIIRIVFVGLLGRIPFLSIPLVVAPPLARWTQSVWVAPPIVALLMVALYLARQPLFNVAMAVPWPDRPNRMICSEFTRRVLEATFGSNCLPGLAAVKPSMTAPGDLLQALLGRSDYSQVPTGVPRAVTDYTRGLPSQAR